jgi:hypothetical protein
MLSLHSSLSPEDWEMCGWWSSFCFHTSCIYTCTCSSWGILYFSNNCAEPCSSLPELITPLIQLNQYFLEFIALPKCTGTPYSLASQYSCWHLKNLPCFTLQQINAWAPVFISTFLRRERVLSFANVLQWLWLMLVYIPLKQTIYLQ